MPRPILPPDDQIDIAIEWLRNYESNEPTTDPAFLACGAVADALDAEMSDRLIRREARKAGLPVAAVRRKLAARKAVAA
jgi:hypothetical protein